MALFAGNIGAVGKEISISTAAVFGSLVFFGYFFEATRPWSSLFCTIQYPVGNQLVATHYGYGLADLLPLFFYTGMALMITSGTEDIIKTLRIGHDTEDFAHQMTGISFYASSVILGIFALTKGGYDLTTYWNGFPYPEVPFLLKVFFLVQLAFLFQRFPHALILPQLTEEVFSSIAEAELLIAFLTISYILGLVPIGTAVVTAHYVANLLGYLANNMSQSCSFKKYGRLAVEGLEMILTIGVAICIFKYGESHSLLVRSSLLIAAFVWTSFELLEKSRKGGVRGSSGSRMSFLSAESSSQKRIGSQGRRGSGERSSRARRGQH